MKVADPHALIDNLCSLPRETEWLEFKHNWFEPEEIGKYVSGLANSAMLAEEERAYLVFGVRDGDHQIVGTNVSLKSQKYKGQIYEHWLCNLLNPSISIQFIEFDYDGKSVNIIIIDPAYISPVRFKGESFVRVDTALQSLRNHSERERQLWAITSRFSFEQGIALSHISIDDLFEKFDCENLFRRLGKDATQRGAMIDQMLMEGLIVDDMQGGFDATNLLAIVAAKNLSDFSLIASKAPRFIQYKGPNKLTGVEDITGTYGYCVAFTRLLKFIMEKIPKKEEIKHGVRAIRYAIPEVSVREILANALIHQDLTASGSGPRIEIFSDRIKITSIGKPLIATQRLIDAPAKSRNERLAGLMRRLGFCEERGSGIDRALDAIEEAALPAPLFQEVENSLVVTIFHERPFSAMSKEDRIRACYQHASLKFENGTRMSNATLRGRFALGDKQYAQVSVVIRDTIEAGLIRPLDEDQAKRTARYVPFWA